LIAAVDKNYLIGKENHLPWNIKEDLWHFRQTTMRHPIVMGRKTWNSIGKPLAGRINVILTHDIKLQIPGCVVAHSINQIMQDFTDQQIFVIGGAETFKQFLPLVKSIYLTRIHAEYDGDTYFPEIEWNDWIENYYEQITTSSGLILSFETWKRRE